MNDGIVKTRRCGDFDCVNVTAFDFMNFPNSSQPVIVARPNVNFHWVLFLCHSVNYSILCTCDSHNCGDKNVYILQKLLSWENAVGFLGSDNFLRIIAEGMYLSCLDVACSKNNLLYDALLGDFHAAVSSPNNDTLYALSGKILFIW